MKILVYANEYLPVIGGLQAVTDTVCRQLVCMGHDVTVVTATSGECRIQFPYRLERNCSVSRFLSLFIECDVFWQASVSLKTCLLPIVAAKPWVVTHHMLLQGKLSWLKRIIARFANGVAVSNFMSAHIGDGSIVISNPYRDDVFLRDPAISKEKDIIFVGRLIRDKGCHILLDAVHRLKARGIALSVSIVGDGEQSNALRDRAKLLDIDNEVVFRGPLQGATLVAALNEHRIIAVPSIWDEPFGIVVLEGLACGCVPVVSNVGGMREVAETCGVLVAPGSSLDLAAAIEHVLSAPSLNDVRERAAEAVLAHCSAKSVATKYETLFRQLSCRE